MPLWIQALMSRSGDKRDVVSSGRRRRMLNGTPVADCVIEDHICMVARIVLCLR